MMDSAPNVFLGSLDRVLAQMAAHLPIATVIAPKGRLRNMRLEHRLRGQGVDWIEVADRSEYLEAVADLPPRAVCAVAGFSWRIEQPFIDSSDMVINFHPGDLLSCRGPQPLEAALWHGHEHIGACAHLIDSEEMDSGPMLERRLIEVDQSRGFHWHKQRSQDLLSVIAEQIFQSLAAGDTLAAERWDVSASHWYPQLEPEQRAQLYKVARLSGLNA